MKKNNALLIIVMVLLSLNAHAEEAQPQTNTDNPTPATSAQNNAADSKDYIVPRPQASRIRALETSLMGRRLNHQIQILDANGDAFLTLYRPSITSSTQGCIILLHSDNEHPDWPDAIAPLRNALPEHSWCTLSIEVPDVIKRGAPVKVEAAPSAQDNSSPPTTLPNQDVVFARIQAAINKAQTEGADQSIFLGYKTGASYALNFLADNPNSGEALVLIDIASTTGFSDYETAQKIRQVAQPILDYYVNDTSGSDQFAMWRKQAANQRTEKRGNYIQLDALPDRVTGKDSKQLLIQRVRGFLKQNTSQINQQKTLPSINKGLYYESPING
ncbi:DUF3530 family protein [Marinomonas profundimaris]|uniref:DUF3530 family protein n=1 Tax=Marinomonas profundimaris TaxID=1208321 RepID=W1RY49_9GAMM|nr:DUF3530 family protein [Marinomonas profundimaris]ETI61750.1 hypothetical protein D104_03840 [Marinomonas profundimaris]